MQVVGNAAGRVAGRLPPWQAVPGTSFVVDKFSKGTANVACQHWFLSHFHADHYGGLTRGFKQGQLLNLARISNLMHCQIGSCAAGRGHCSQAHMDALPATKRLLPEEGNKHFCVTCSANEVSIQHAKLGPRTIPSAFR